MKEKECLCGCGNFSKYGNYILGHCSRMPDIKKSKSEKMKKNNPMNNPIYKKNFYDAVRLLEYRKKRSKEYSGKGNPMFGKKRLDIIGDKNPMRQKDIKEKHLNAVNNLERREKHSLLMSGSGNPNWQNGKSFEPYDSNFNDKLKDTIKKIHNYKCFSCSIDNKNLDIHHIDKNKKNNNIDNLIPLCKKCHGKLHFHKP